MQLNADYTFDMLRTGTTKARHGVAIHFLTSIIAPYAAALRGFYRLAVDHPGTG